MASLKALKIRIGSVKSTQKITKALNMVAASKLRRAQQNAKAARPYSERMRSVVESLAGSCKATEWIEREMAELLGITFRNHPDMRHLLLADDWPEGRYPLRRADRGGAPEPDVPDHG